MSDYNENLKNLLQKKIGILDLSKVLDDLVKFRIPTGIRGIDLIIGGGIPASRLTEIYGDFTTGKSRLLYHILAICQKMGGYAILLDQERGYSSGLAELTGLDHNRLIYADPDKIITIEDIFECIKISINVLREADPDCLIAIGWDSVAMGVTREDLESKDLSVATSAARRAKVIGDGLRKIMPLVYKNKICLIFINQIRDRIGVMYGEKIDTVGGKMIKFAASLRLHCYLAGKIKEETDTSNVDIIRGFKGRLVVDKSKICRPFEYCEFQMFVDKPIDVYSGLRDVLVRRGEIIDLGRKKYKWGEKEFHEDEFIEIYTASEGLIEKSNELIEKRKAKEILSEKKGDIIRKITEEVDDVKIVDKRIKELKEKKKRNVEDF